MTLKKGLLILAGIVCIVLLFQKMNLHSIRSRRKKSSDTEKWRYLVEEEMRKAILTDKRKRALKEEKAYVFRKGGISQTEQWLSVVGWEKVKEGFEYWQQELNLPLNIDELRKFSESVIIPREKQHSDNYFAFYHATDKGFWVFFEFQKQLYRKIFQKSLDNFYFLRDLETFEKHKSVETWLEKQPRGTAQKAQLYLIYDLKEYYQKQLLATNIGLPGNLEPGESSAYRFLLSWSARKPPYNTLFTQLIHSYAPLKSLKKQNIEEAALKLEKLCLEVSSNNNFQGLLLTIFIPKYMADQVAYMSEKFGQYPPEGYYSDTDLPSVVLEVLLHAPKEVKHIENIQARLRLTDAIFADPNAGIKIFLDHKIPKKITAEIKKRIGKIVDELVLPLEDLNILHRSPYSL